MIARYFNWVIVCVNHCNRLRHIALCRDERQRDGFANRCCRFVRCDGTVLGICNRNIVIDGVKARRNGDVRRRHGEPVVLNRDGLIFPAGHGPAVEAVPLIRSRGQRDGVTEVRCCPICYDRAAYGRKHGDSIVNGRKDCRDRDVRLRHGEAVLRHWQHAAVSVDYRKTLQLVALVGCDGQGNDVADVGGHRHRGDAAVLRGRYRDGIGCEPEADQHHDVGGGHSEAVFREGDLAAVFVQNGDRLHHAACVGGDGQGDGVAIVSGLGPGRDAAVLGFGNRHGIVVGSVDCAERHVGGGHGELVLRHGDLVARAVDDGEAGHGVAHSVRGGEAHNIAVIGRLLVGGGRAMCRLHRGDGIDAAFKDGGKGHVAGRHGEAPAVVFLRHRDRYAVFILCPELGKHIADLWLHQQKDALARVVDRLHGLHSAVVPDIACHLIVDGVVVGNDIGLAVGHGEAAVGSDGDFVARRVGHGKVVKGITGVGHNGQGHGVARVCSGGGGGDGAVGAFDAHAEIRAVFQLDGFGIRDVSVGIVNPAAVVGTAFRGRDAQIVADVQAAVSKCGIVVVYDFNAVDPLFKPQLAVIGSEGARQIVGRFDRSVGNGDIFAPDGFKPGYNFKLALQNDGAIRHIDAARTSRAVVGVDLRAVFALDNQLRQL